MSRYSFAGYILLLLAQPAIAQDSDQPDSLRDDFLDSLVGRWNMQGYVMKDSVEYDAKAEWVLGHQFLRFRMKDVNTPSEYEAHVYIGYDPQKERYVAHWLDTFGGSSSETLGYGHKKGKALQFHFQYPDGPFQTTFEKKLEGTWHLLMRTQAQPEGWQTFAEYTIRPAN